MPPWPGSSTTVAPPMGSPPATVLVLPHGVMTCQAPGPPPVIGTTKPFGVASTSALSSSTNGRRGVVVVVVGATVVLVVVVVDVVVGLSVVGTATFGSPPFEQAARR